MMIPASFEPDMLTTKALAYGGLTTLVEEGPTHRVYHVKKAGRAYDVITAIGTDQDTFMMVAASEKFRLNHAAYRWLQLVGPTMPVTAQTKRIAHALNEADVRYADGTFRAIIKLRPDDAKMVAAVMRDATKVVPIVPRDRSAEEDVAITGQRMLRDLETNMREGVYKRMRS